MNPTSRSRVSVLLATTALGLGGAPAVAQGPCESEVRASDASPDEQFGQSVSISGTTAIVGAPYDIVVDSHAGSAYIFELTAGEWTEQAKLTASDGADTVSFGRAVSISGDTAAIGASEAVYIFQRTGSVWTQQVKLTPSDTASTRHFGWSLSLSGDIAIVGSPGDEHPATLPFVGSAYIFERTGDVWAEQATLTASDASAYDYFGASVSICGDTAIVGAGLTYSPGAAYVFQRDGDVWNEQAKFTADDPGVQGVGFGRSVSVSGDTAIMGAYREGPGSRGSVYVFQRSGNTWTPQTTLMASDAGHNAGFGYSVLILGDTAIVGAYRDDETVLGAGAVYIFRRHGAVWTEQSKRTAADANAADWLGTAVSLSGDTALAGAPHDDDAGQFSAGSAYFFRLGPPGDLTGPNPGDPPDGTVNIFDLLLLLSAFGTAGPDGDLTGPDPGDPPDGQVNVFDLIEMLSHLGEACPAS